MTSRHKQLLDARAQRGTARGADTVWRHACETAASGTAAFKSAASETPPSPWSTVWFRVAIVACLVAFSLLLVRPLGSWPAAAPAEDSDPPVEDSMPSQPTPDRILVGDFPLERISIPADPDFVGDDDFFDRFSSRNYVTSFSGDDRPVERVVFANPAEPFSNPILVIEPLDGGGFRPTGLNLGPVTVESLTESLVRQDGVWAMDETSELTEVARISENSLDQIRFGWQFDFRSGSETAVWQAEQHDGAGVWVWVARAALGSVDRPLAVREIDVLGNPGLLIDQQASEVLGRDPGDQAVWTNGAFVYRLTGGRIEDNTVFGRSVIPLLGELRVVDDATWDDNVAKANRLSAWQMVSGLVQLVVLPCWLLTSLYLALRGPRLHALWGVAAIAGWWTFEPHPLVSLTLAVGLAYLWFRLWRSGRLFSLSRDQPHQQVDL